MCGIAGAWSRTGELIDPRAVAALTDALVHRGPDDGGTWIAADGRAGLGHRRLAIVDPTQRGRQPMRWPAPGSADHAGEPDLVVTYNGEIYNAPALRDELTGLGIGFATTCDTEVVLAAYATWGLDGLERLRGMFALALVDRRRDRLVLARDPLGIKPLYVHDDGGRVTFASEIPALIGQAGIGPGTVDPDALADYLLWGSVAAPRTIYRDVRSLEPGEVRVLERTPSDRRRPMSEPLDLLDGEATTTDPWEAREVLSAALRDSVGAHLAGDVPVGLLLSGGVDSAVLAHLLGQVAPDTTAFTVGNGDHGDRPGASRTATETGLRHVMVEAGDLLSPATVNDVVRSLGQPTIDGINTWTVAGAMREVGVKVALAGVGADELFGGYPSFRRVPRMQRARPFLGSIAGAVPAPRPGDARSRPLEQARWLHYAGQPWGAYAIAKGIFAPHQVAALTGRPVAEITALVAERLAPREMGARGPAPVDQVEAGQYLRHQLLPAIDVASMASSLEVRTPFVDVEVLRAVGTISRPVRLQGPDKALLRSLAPHLTATGPARPPKQGFTAPIAAWIDDGSLVLERPRHPLLVDAVVDAAWDGAEGAHWSRRWALHVLAAGAFDA